MDEFNSKSIFYKQSFCGCHSGPPKTYGRKAARRTIKQNSWQYIEDYYDVTYCMGDLDWFQEYDCDYWDDLSFYDHYIEEYHKAKEEGLELGYALS